MTNVYKSELQKQINIVRDTLEQFKRRDSLENASIFVMALRALVVFKGYGIGYMDNIQMDGSSRYVKMRIHVLDKNSDQVRIFSLMESCNTYGQFDRKIDAKMEAMANEIIAMPPHDDYMRGLWLGKLKVLASEGESLNMGMEYTEMLRATAERLATNILPAPSSVDKD